jgi:hypothetical protein
MEREKQVPIWFFIGALLAVYGLIIFGSGVYGWVNPPPADQRVKLWDVHADVWWGALLVIFGLVYVVKFWPSKPESLTGKIEEPDAGPITARREA